ncbi:hypothetical protein C8039_05745 [Halogeometricum sp. wsp3]|nr:hypothetical protein C8039_05745 [Halogeometricum sp. wsp3]
MIASGHVIPRYSLGHPRYVQDRDGRLLSVGQQRRASLAIGLATDPIENYSICLAQTTGRWCY